MLLSIGYPIGRFGPVRRIALPMSSMKTDGASLLGIYSDPPVSLPDGPYEGLAPGSFHPIYAHRKAGRSDDYGDHPTRVLSKYPWANTERRRRLALGLLVFDCGTKRLTVQHEWETSGHSGMVEFDLDEFLAQEGAPQTALIDELFRPVLIGA